MRLLSSVSEVVPPPQQENSLIRIKKYHPHLQFTLEIGNRSINFLDLTVTVIEDFGEINPLPRRTFSENLPLQVLLR